MNEPFLSAIPLLKKIEDAGFEAFFVGGSVRDLLLGKSISDVDIATSATPQEMKAIFQKTIDVGIEHGTIIVLYNGIPYEVTTFRSEAEYVDYRKPKEVQFIRSLETDLERRDFTMNAIAMDTEGQFIDPFDGRKAINDKIIKTVGKAEERFSEDALRMMRALRFYSQLGFIIEENTYRALRSSCHLLEHISVERKLAEFEKLLIGKNRTNALSMLVETHLHEYLPGLSLCQEGLKNVAFLDCKELQLEEMWGLLLNQFEVNYVDSTRFLKAWKMPMKKIKHISSILRWLEYRSENEWTDITLYHATIQIAVSTEKLVNVLQQHNVNRNISELMESYERLPIKQRSRLEVSGNDLQAWFQKKPGPWIKEAIEIIEAAVIKKELANEKDKIREWLFRCNLK